MGDTTIEWTEKTWNPTRGCELVSPGCTNCYAMKFAHRFSGTGKPFEGLTRLRKKGGPVWTGEGRLALDMLDVPLRVRKPTTWFVNSMSDLFWEKFTNEEIAAVFGVMAACPQHTFQVLTKRAKRMRDWFKWVASQDGIGGRLSATNVVQESACNVEQTGRYMMRFHPPIKDPPWPLPNVWLGVSVEDQKRADERIPDLLKTPAAVRFLSAEPLLERVSISRWIEAVSVCSACNEEHPQHEPGVCPSCGTDNLITVWGHEQLARLRSDERYENGGPSADEDGPQLDWVIVGGESGPGSRPMHPDWVRSIRDQCVSADVKFFFKQWGSHAPVSDEPRPGDMWCLGGGQSQPWKKGDVGATPGKWARDGDVIVRPMPKKSAGRLLDGREWNEMPEARA